MKRQTIDTNRSDPIEGGLVPPATDQISRMRSALSNVEDDFHDDDAEHEEVASPPAPMTSPTYELQLIDQALPRDFRMTWHGLVHDRIDREGKIRSSWICDLFFGWSEGRDSQNKCRRIEICFYDAEGEPHIESLDRGDLAARKTDVISQLASAGLRMNNERGSIELLKTCLAGLEIRRRVRDTLMIGWQENGAFVLPHCTVGVAEGETIELGLDPRLIEGFSAKGSVKDWRANVAKLARNNSRLIFGVNIAFLGSMLSLVTAENPIFHFHGNSSIGKTTIARLSASVWGSPTTTNSLLGTWSTTNNALEVRLAARQDTILILDEVGHADPNVVLKSAYQIAGQTGKGRMSGGRVKPPAKWRVAVMSTGECPFRYVAQQAHGRSFAGQEVRFIDVPADAQKGLGVFETLNDCSDARELADKVRAAAEKHFGTAGPAFVADLIKDRNGAVDFFEATVKEFVKSVSKSGADGQVLRVARNFAMVAASGALAASFGIVPWSEADAIDAAKSCFEAWLDARGHQGSNEVEMGIKTALDRLEKLATRLPAHSNVVSDRDAALKEGFVRHDSRAGVYVLPSIAKCELFKDILNPKMILTAMRERGHLLPRQPNELTSGEKDPASGKTVRYYRFAIGTVFQPELQAETEVDGFAKWTPYTRNQDSSQAVELLLKRIAKKASGT